MTINDFVNLKEPEKFDFTDDCTFDENYKSKSGLDKFFEYRINSKVKDPDVYSKLLQEIYSICWKDILKDSEDFMCRDGWIASDTMTSAWKPIKGYIIKKFEKELRELQSEKKYRTITNNVCKELYETNQLSVFGEKEEGWNKEPYILAGHKMLC